MGMTHDDFIAVEFDKDFHWHFFFCELCPISLPFLKEKTAWAYAHGHTLNPYHKRRLELQR